MRKEKTCLGCKKKIKNGVFYGVSEYLFCRVCVEEMLQKKRWEISERERKSETKRKREEQQEKRTKTPSIIKNKTGQTWVDHTEGSAQERSEARVVYFGKYKGWQVQNLPQDYLDWWSQQEEVPDTIRKEYNRRKRTSKT